MTTIFKYAGMPSREGTFITEDVQTMISDAEERGYVITDKMIVQHHDRTSPRLCILAHK